MDGYTRLLYGVNMAYKFRDSGIEDRRIRIALFKLRNAVQTIHNIEQESLNLFDKEDAIEYIEMLSGGILPSGDELILNFEGMNMLFESDSQFINMEFNYNENTIVKYLYNVLQIGEEQSNVDEFFEYDSLSYEVLNEIYRATKLLYREFREFFGHFEEVEYEEFAANNNYDDSGREGTIIYEFNTKDIDDDLDQLFEEMKSSDSDIYIADDTTRNEIKHFYDTLRDKVKFFFTFDRIDDILQIIEDLLFSLNGLRKFDTRLNMALEEGEEVFFPMHNKSVVDFYTMGGSYKF